MKDARLLLVLLLLGALVAPARGQSATDLKKELFPKIRKAQADGKDLGPAAAEYKLGDDALKNGLMDEAIEHFQKAKAAMPADAK